MMLDFWAEKELEQSLLETDIELAGALAAESFKRRTSLIQGVANLATTAYYTRGYFGSSTPSTLGQLDPMTQLSGDAYLRARGIG